MADFPNTNQESQSSYLTPERKLKYKEYVAQHATSCLVVLSERNDLWKLQEVKQQVTLLKPVQEWSGLNSAKAVSLADISFKNVLQTLLGTRDSKNFTQFFRTILGDWLLDARVIEDFDHRAESEPFDSILDIELQPHTAIKWWAIKASPVNSKPTDFYVLEYIGVEMKEKEIKRCYLYQESLADQHHRIHTLENISLERVTFNTLLCAFEPQMHPHETIEQTQISVVYQRRSPIIPSFRGNVSMEMAFQFANGLRNLSQTPVYAPEVPVLESSEWVKDKERPKCVLCLRKFSTIYRRRHHCRICGEIICSQCSSIVRAAARLEKLEDKESCEKKLQSDIRVCMRCAEVYSLISSSAHASIIEKSEAEHTSPEAVDCGTDVGMDENRDLPQGDSDTPDQDIAHIENSLQISEEHAASSIFVNSFEKDSYGRGSDELDPEEFEISRSRGTLNSDVSEIALSDIDDSVVDKEITSACFIKVEHFKESLTCMRKDPMVTGPNDSVKLSRSNAYEQFLRKKINRQSNQRQLYRTRSDCSNLRSQVQENSVSSASPSLCYLDPPQNLRQSKSAVDFFDVKSASAWASNTVEKGAISDAFQMLRSKLGGEVHFLVVGFTSNFRAERIISFLRELAPGVPYIGGTIASGVCDEHAWVSRNRQMEESLVALWGVNDPYGIYTVVHADFDQSDAKEKSYAATKAAYARMKLDFRQAQSPAFLMLNVCRENVDEAIEGIREAIHCPLIGGCTPDAAKREGFRFLNSPSYQISSSNSTDYTTNVTDTGGDKTELGIAFALCYPSVETHTCWFSGYMPAQVSEYEHCTGTVTKASEKNIYEIDDQPATRIYMQWLDQLSSHRNTNLSKVEFPRLGNLHPIGSIVGPSFAEVDMMSCVNATAVIQSMNKEEDCLVSTSSITPGTRILLMEATEDSLKASVMRLKSEFLKTRSSTSNEAVGCFMFISSGLHALLGHRTMNAMTEAFQQHFPGVSLMGMTTLGEIGHLSNMSDFPHYDSLMFSAIFFTNKPQMENLFV